MAYEEILSIDSTIEKDKIPVSDGLSSYSWQNIPKGFSGDYNDLKNKPTIPSKPSDIGAEVAGAAQQVKQEITGGSTTVKQAECDSNGNIITSTYSTKSEVKGKQSTITANGILKGNGGGTITAATANYDYLPVDNATLKGVPTAPTAANGTSTTQIATTEFINNTIAAVLSKEY